ncbi:TVP38/TMEM64 family protein [Thomasclavelia spiroformis]|jgi:uncharacterized membrane protein YdjX (TVP38/TMEM64 family)|uniref:TVP38/TMEM64 family protein n=1 Tax=Thomasclavelia spiroformis TaxID=29348 RepID=UPI00265FDC53|nr:TVP38/TMEM64 family protein [Thomasclavelia spiroformis]
MNLSFNKNYLTILSFIILLFFGFIGYQSGIFSSPQNLEAFLKTAGIFAPIIFILIQIVQCVIPIIPGGVSCVIGVAFFGPLWGFVYNFIGISTGSIINFLLAKRYGKNIVLKLVSQNNYNKYISWIEKGKKFDKLFAIAMFVPCAPDDLLCFLAGLTPMSLKKFIFIILTCKPWSIAAYSLGLNMVISWVTSLF